MNTEEAFLREKLVPALKKIDPYTKGNWGVMSPQQMVEHLSDSLAIAYGKLVLPVVSPPERKEAMYQFLQSDIPFKENTKNPLLSDIPPPPRFSSMDESIEKLQKQLSIFFETFEKNPDLITTHPIFNELNYQGNMRLLYKHSMHHLKQFGIEV